MSFRWRTLLWTAVGVVAAMCAVAVLVSAFVSVETLGKVRDTQLEGTPTGKKLLDAAEQIKSCTTPGQVCYDRSQRRTADVVGDISLSQVAAVACADRPGTQTPPEIKACVDRTLRVYASTH